MLTMAERQERIARVRDLPARVESAVGGLGDEQLNAPGGEGEWTLRQVVHHLADSHLNLFVRMKLALTEERPTQKPYDQDEWAKLPDTVRVPIQPSLWILRGLHQRCHVLLESLSEEAWRRPAYHPETGELTLDDLLVTMSDHGEAHLDQIARQRAGQGGK